MLRMRSLRGPASYTTGGDSRVLGDIVEIAQSSGRMVTASIVSSSYYRAEVVNASGSAVVIMVRDMRSGALEAASTTDLSTLHFCVIYDGF